MRDTKHPLSSLRSNVLFATIAGTALAVPALADITWEFTSTDGANTFTGSMTTTGNPGDEQTVGSVFDLISVESISYNGTPITVWRDGSSLPFVATSPADQIIVVSAGNAELEPNTGNSLQAMSDDLNFNFIVLARPGTVAESAALDAIPAVPSFAPTSTTFTVPPKLVTNTTQGTQFETLQEALNTANNGDVIDIAAGTLFEDNIVFPNGVDVTVRGAGRDLTVIDGGGAADLTGSMLGLDGQSTATVISDLTMRNGHTDDNFVGAAINSTSSAAIFRDVAFRDFVHTGNGHTAAFIDADQGLRFESCIFSNSQADEGLLNTSSDFIGCLFYGNDVARVIRGSAMVQNCTIDASNAALHPSGGTIDVSNTVMTGLLVDWQGGTINRTHCLYAGAPAGNGNIDGAPTFVDAAGGDYRLAQGSLGIDAADYAAYLTAGGGATDLNGDDRYRACILDMGAFEYQDPFNGTVSNVTEGATYCTLQDALNNALNGDVIELPAGTHFEDGINFPSGLDVTIRGAGKDLTFIDGGNGPTNVPIFNMVSTGQSAATVFSDLTLQNGVMSSGTGGGAVRISGSSPSFHRVRFKDSVGTIGSHILADASSSRFEFCEFIGGSGAGAVADSGAANTSYHQCLFAGSIAAVDSFTSTATLESCTIASTGAALRVLGNAQVSSTNCVIVGSFDNQGGTFTTMHCLYPGAPAVDGNIDGAPTFVDAASGDYRLAPGSLGIDAADYDAYVASVGSFFDLAGTYRILDNAAPNTGAGNLSYLDMGAYESNLLTSDCNTNGIEDSDDLVFTGAFTDFESGAGHGYTLNGTNPGLDAGSIRLTEIGVQGQLATAIFDPQLAQPVGDFRASFDFQMLYGTGFGADGISFALLDKAVHDTSALFSEQGPGTGAIVIRMPEYITASMAIVQDGVTIASMPIAHDINDGNWHHMDIELSGGDLSVTLTPWNGAPETLGAAGITAGFDALYGFGSRTGADTNEQRIDNVRFESLVTNDCDGNGVPDQCDPDTNGDGIPDACQCEGDANGDGVVDIADLNLVLGNWGGSGVGDVNSDGTVDIADLNAVLAGWGLPC